MYSFALVTEGKTDQAFLSTILDILYGDEISVTEAQPLFDETDLHKGKNFGGWEQVFEYCSSENFRQQFIFSDFVIIQVDTDCASHVDFDVPLCGPDGNERSAEDIICDVKNRMISKIGEDFFKEHCSSIIFAISIHSLECWLLPLYAVKNKKPGRTHNCEHHLNVNLTRLKIKYEKDYRPYLELSKPLRKIDKLNYCRSKSESFDIFLKSLPP